MNRENSLHHIREQKTWDICIIGGGATGLGAALDAASRGYSTLLLEKYDFAKGTSSRSTKLVHGGVRYLAQGNIKLVREALQERGILLRNAPHICRVQPFIIPSYSRWQQWYYGTGLRVYDWLSGSYSLGPTRWLNRETVRQLLPTVRFENLSGGVEYLDGQFDDARLAIAIARTAHEQGAVLANYMEVQGLLHEKKKVCGVRVTDRLTEQEYEIRARVVINATGVFTDSIIRMDDAEAEPLVAPSQGIHLVLDASFFPSREALMIPRTEDGRVLFAVPWLGKVVVGTTDTPLQEIRDEPQALEEEVEFVLQHINRYLTVPVNRKDVRSVFAGLRPLVRKSGQSATSLLSRDHTIVVSKSGLVSITGGKWTTYRKMGRDAIDNAVFVARLGKTDCRTRDLRLAGYREDGDASDPLFSYGSDADEIRSWQQGEGAERIANGYAYTKAEVLWALRKEMACTLEDVLARRLRLLFLDARAALQAAPAVAALMARERGHDEAWIREELDDFTELAEEYMLH